MQGGYMICNDHGRYLPVESNIEKLRITKFWKPHYETVEMRHPKRFLFLKPHQIVLHAATVGIGSWPSAWRTIYGFVSRILLSEDDQTRTCLINYIFLLHRRIRIRTEFGWPWRSWSACSCSLLTVQYHRQRPSKYSPFSSIWCPVFSICYRSVRISNNPEWAHGSMNTSDHSSATRWPGDGRSSSLLSASMHLVNPFRSLRENVVAVYLLEHSSKHT